MSVKTNMPCTNGGTCVDTHGSYKCLGPNGLTGRNCERLVSRWYSREQTAWRSLFDSVTKMEK